MFKNPPIDQLEERQPVALMHKMNIFRTVISIYPLIFVIAILLGFMREPSLPAFFLAIVLLIFLIGAWRFGASLAGT